jgi:guanylate kinase
LESGETDLILDIDTQGAKKALKETHQPILIYLLPPSLKVLRERLINRGVDSIEMVKYRLSNARRDMEESHWYHYVIINDRIEDAIEKLRAIIIAERCRKIKDLILEENKKQWEENDG